MYCLGLHACEEVQSGDASPTSAFDMVVLLALALGRRVAEMDLPFDVDATAFSA
jgi:hypothetical protein